MKRGYKISRSTVNVPQPTDLMMVMSMLKARSGKDLNIIQVGANDGKTHDPVFEGAGLFAERIILVEPQPDLIPVLKKNYDSFKGEAIFENMAVADSEGELPIYKVDDDTRDVLLKGGVDPSIYASFSREHVVRHLSSSWLNWSAEEADKHIVSVPVPTLPLKELIEKHNMTEPDVLQIDCEGYDWQVLKTIGEFRPAVINLESRHIPEDERLEMEDWFRKNHYHFTHIGRDCFAVKAE